MSATTTTDQLLETWRQARRDADELHRKALDDADKIYKTWLVAQQDAATRGAALVTATWEDRLAALQVLAEATLHMRKPGDWYCSMSRTAVSNGVIQSSSAGNGRTPAEAVEAMWRRLTQLAPEEYIAVGYGDERVNALWDGNAWKTWKPAAGGSDA